MAAKFKVGDRVRVSKTPSNGGYGEVGDTGTIEVVYVGDVYLAFDSGSRAGESWCISTAEIEHITETPITIQAGRYYKTRDGRKVGPMEERGYAGQMFDKSKAITGYGWNKDGSFLPSRSQIDLIAEWMDEPVAPKPKSKFKVGDRVKFREDYGSSAAGNKATVIEVNKWGVMVEDQNGIVSTEAESDLRLVRSATDDKFKVGDHVRILRHENNNGDKIKMDLPIGSTHRIVEITDQIPGVQCCLLSGSKVHFYTPNNLERITASPAIVALIENGQPKPATRPFVHRDRASAEREASRLAGVHKGQKFGVYEFVSSAKEAKVYQHEWQRLAADGKKIAAIKEMRAVAGLTLKGAKDAVEHWYAYEIERAA